MMFSNNILIMFLRRKHQKLCKAHDPIGKLKISCLDCPSPSHLHHHFRHSFRHEQDTAPSLLFWKFYIPLSRFQYSTSKITFLSALPRSLLAGGWPSSWGASCRWKFTFLLPKKLWAGTLSSVCDFPSAGQHCHRYIMRIKTLEKFTCIMITTCMEGTTRT